MTEKIILIGGPPGVCKSTLAYHISAKYNIPYLSTDDIKGDYLNTLKTTDVNGLLHLPNIHQEEDYLLNNSAESIATSHYDDGKVIWNYIKSKVLPKVTGSVIVEGIHVLPHLIDEEKSDKRIISIYLTYKEDHTIMDLLNTRGVWLAGQKNPMARQKEFEWISIFNKRIKDDAKKYNMVCTEISDRNLIATDSINLLQL